MEYMLAFNNEKLSYSHTVMKKNYSEKLELLGRNIFLNSNRSTNVWHILKWMKWYRLKYMGKTPQIDISF